MCRGSVPTAVGVHDPDKVREQLSHAIPTAEYRQQSVPEGLQRCGAARHSAQHLRQDHPVYCSGKLHTFL